MKKEDKIYLALVATISVTLFTSNLVAQIPVNLFGGTVYLSMFIYPLIFFFADVITKNYGIQSTQKAVACAIIIQASAFVSQYIAMESMEISLWISSIVTFIIGQLINAMIYNYLITNEKENDILIFLGLVFSLLIDNIIFTVLMNLGNLNSSIFNVLTISNVIKVIYAFVITALLKEKKKMGV